MKKIKIFSVTMLLVIFIVSMSACSNASSEDATSTNSDSTVKSSTTSDETTNEQSTSQEDGTEQDQNLDQEDTTDTTNQDDDNLNQDSTEENADSTDTSNETIQEENSTSIVTKVDGRKSEFLGKLDNIQKELDALPEKKDSDKGVTNAMKNYYGKSYEMYDKALNEIYALLQKELSQETMAKLKAEQLKWIEKKEDQANKERLKYEGGTFENVAFYISLYESTKERCYELVNEYMTD